MNKILSARFVGFDAVKIVTESPVGENCSVVVGNDKSGDKSAPLATLTGNRYTIPPRSSVVMTARLARAAVQDRVESETLKSDVIEYEQNYKILNKKLLKKV